MTAESCTATASEEGLDTKVLASKAFAARRRPPLPDAQREKGDRRTEVERGATQKGNVTSKRSKMTSTHHEDKE